MATQQGPARRNGVIGFQMTGASTPAIPLNTPRRNGPIGFQMMPGSSHIANPSSSLINQGPPHGITPWWAPTQPILPPQCPTKSGTARGQRAQCKTDRCRSDNLSARDGAGPGQVPGLGPPISNKKPASHHSLRRTRQDGPDGPSIDYQPGARYRWPIQGHREQIRPGVRGPGTCRGQQKCPQKIKQTIEQDRADIQDLRKVVCAAEVNLRRQERLTGAEDRMNGLLKNMERMLAAAMQNTRENKVLTRKVPIAESSTNPVSIARRHVVGSQEQGSHGQVFDPHPRQLGKGKERGPRSLRPEDLHVDGYISSNVDVSGGSLRSRSESTSVISDVMPLDSCRSSREGSPMDITTEAPEVTDPSVLSDVMPLDSCRSSREGSPMDLTTDATEVTDPSVLSDVIMSLDSCRSSREGSPMDITTEATEQELAAHMSQVDDQNAAVHEAPATTLAITPQQVETYDMMENRNQLFYFELAKLNGEAFDGYMEWEPAETTTVFNKDDQAAPSQASSGPSLPFLPVDSNENVLMIPGQVTSAVIPPDTSSPCDIPTSLPLRKTIANRMATARAMKLPSNRRRVFKRKDRPTGSLRRSVRQRVIKSVNLPVRKRTAGIVEFGHNEGPNRKKRITKELVEANGSQLLSLSEVYVMNTAPKVPEVSVPAVSQPAQSVQVSTEEVPTQAVMSEPAVSQPTQIVLEYTEYTESAMTEQAVMSEPAVSQPTQTVLEYNETVPTEQVPTEAAMSAPAVPQPTQAAQEATEQVPIDAALSEPAVSQPTQAVSEDDESLETVQVPTEAVMSVPAVSQPTQTVLESTVPESSVLQSTSLASIVSIPSDEVVGAPAPSEPAPTKSAQTEPSSAEEIQSVPAATKPTLNESDLTWQTEDELVIPSLRTGTRSHLDVLLDMRAARIQARRNIMSSPEGLQLTAASRIISTSSLVASPEDASVKNAVATGTDSRAGVSKGTKRVEDANPTCGAQRTAGEQREEICGEEAATSGLQMPGAWPSDPPAVTVSDESDTHEGSALLRGVVDRSSLGVLWFIRHGDGDAAVVPRMGRSPWTPRLRLGGSRTVPGGTAVGARI
ncbi:uncharacterized protein N7487_000748 [Penicillium crustosum]|uniref:uncharacterized protein n=1 Tax=Penicillium crustosum TaxID=36656 RepID=UPI0023926E3F|nr:uncharacterized protein N7487_000748 [Penicillium crustosum]KAJ5417198.1 hypothetical protein N7487_000748 [Penicillium crustosum]